MWIFTTRGFFSIVKKGRPGTPYCIRARVREDLESLQSAIDILGPVEEEHGTDYPYRIYATKNDVAQVLTLTLDEMDYTNFKSAVAKLQGYERSHLYSDVWGVMYGAEEKVAKPLSKKLVKRAD